MLGEKASRLKWLDKERNIMLGEEKLYIKDGWYGKKYNAGRIPQKKK